MALPIVNKNCLKCGNGFEKNKFTSRKAWVNTRFCSKKCSGGFRKGKPFKHDRQFKKGQIAWNSGLTKNDNDGMRKLSESKLGDKNPMKRIEVREKSSKSHLGKKLSVTQRKNMSVAQKKRFPDGRKSPDRHIFSFEYKLWRSQVFQRDNWICQTCGLRGVALEAHHIKSWAKYPELRYELDNGVALCRECHKLTDSYKKKLTLHE